MKDSDYLMFEGQLDIEGAGDGPSIGGRDVIAELADADLLGTRCQVMLGVQARKHIHERETEVGNLSAYEGFHGSEVTPAEPPSISVGERDLFDELAQHDGKTVALSVTRMPAQTLHGLGSWLTSMDAPGSFWRPRVTLEMIIQEAHGAMSYEDDHRLDVTDAMVKAAWPVFAKEWNEVLRHGGLDISKGHIKTAAALPEFRQMIEGMLKAAVKAKGA
jgi:hypothetical protein